MSAPGPFGGGFGHRHDRQQAPCRARCDHRGTPEIGCRPTSFPPPAAARRHLSVPRRRAGPPPPSPASSDPPAAQRPRSAAFPRMPGGRARPCSRANCRARHASDAPRPGTALRRPGRRLRRAGKLREARAKVEKLGLKTYVHVAETPAGPRTRVRVGPFATRDEAERAAAKLKSVGLRCRLTLVTAATDMPSFDGTGLRLHWVVAAMLGAAVGASSASGAAWCSRCCRWSACWSPGSAAQGPRPLHSAVAAGGRGRVRGQSRRGAGGRLHRDPPGLGRAGAPCAPAGARDAAGLAPIACLAPASACAARRRRAAGVVAGSPDSRRQPRPGGSARTARRLAALDGIRPLLPIQLAEHLPAA